MTTLKLNPIVKAAWLAALRDPEQKQTKGVLRRSVANHHDAGFCCLGVLCDVHEKATRSPTQTVPNWEANTLGEPPYLGNTLRLPTEVARWAFLDYDKGDATAQVMTLDPCVEIGSYLSELSTHNDGNTYTEIPRRTFAEIADAIEAQL